MSTFAFRVASGVIVGSIGLLCGDALSSGGAAGDRTLHTIPLKYAVAHELYSTISPLAPPGGRILADPRSNSLIVDATPDDFAKIRDLVATVDVPMSGTIEDRGGDDGRGTSAAMVNVAIVEISVQKMTELGIRVGELGSTGLADGPARTIANLADGIGDPGVAGNPGVVVHANVTTPVAFNKRTHLSRSTQHPLAGAPGTPPGAGGYMSAENSIDVLASPNGNDGATLEIQYQVQKVAGGTPQAPIKSAQQGSLQLALRSGDLAVSGGRMAGDSESNLIFLVVRVAVRR